MIQRFSILFGFFLFLGFNLFAQVPNYYPPVPLNMGDFGKEDPNVNSVLFFQHGAVPTSTQNFHEAPSHIKVDNEDIVAYDLLGAPGLPPDPKARPLDWLGMLASPAGLCYENFLPNFTCNVALPAEQALMKGSWSQLIAALRNTFPGESNIPNVSFPNVTLSGNPFQSPYANAPLGSIVGNNLGLGGDESPPAVCYDITAAEDWIACPVFGPIEMATGSDKDQKILEMQSPIIIYRKNEKGIYKLAGYLGNPSISDQNKAGLSGSQLLGDQLRLGNAYFPIAIASGNFEETAAAPGAADIAVASTATLSHVVCEWLITFVNEPTLRMNLPHGSNCSYGFTWVRKMPVGKWGTPHDTFEPADLFLTGPKTYDLATAYDKGKAVLFAPSGAPAKNLQDGSDHFYVYKYYEEGMSPVSITSSLQLILPRVIEVKPPQPGYAPFKIATVDINGDGYDDFAITWKSVAEDRFDSEHNLWKAHYSPYVSIYISSPPSGANGILYKLLDNFTVPKIDSPVLDDKAELAAVSFVQKSNGQKFLVAGNQKRIQVGNLYHAFDYLFNITTGGVVDIHVKPVQVSFKGENADAPGVADITTDPMGNISSVLRKPFLPAPEGCDLNNGEVYGALWLYQIIGLKNIPSLQLAKAEIGSLVTALINGSDGTSVPNRCRCFPQMIGDETNDLNFDDLPDKCVVSDTPTPSRPASLTPTPSPLLPTPTSTPSPPPSSPPSTSPCGRPIPCMIAPPRVTTPLPPPPVAPPVLVTLPSTPPPSSSPFQKHLGPCGGPVNTFTGPRQPCDSNGSDPRAVTAVLPKSIVIKVCDPTKDAACRPPPIPQTSLSVNQFCISKVGREDPKTAAVFEPDQKLIKQANDRVQAITGIKDFDIFVGGEAGAIHWECALVGGAFASPSKVVGALPDVSGNLAPFAVWQVSGVQPLKYTRRPTADLAIQNPLRLTPVDVGEIKGSGGGRSTSVSVANLSSVLPNITNEEFASGDGIQNGNLNYNINGKVLVKVLRSGNDFAAEGTTLSVNTIQSLFALDFIGYPALLSKSVQDSQFSFEDVFKELARRVEEYKTAGKPITLDIYRNLPWEKTMSPEFLIAQTKLPDAVTAANLSLRPPGSSGSQNVDPPTGVRAITVGVPDVSGSSQTLQPLVTNDPNQIVLPAYILPPGLAASGGGCGCNFHVEMQSDVALFQLLLLLIPLCGVIYYRHSLANKKFK